MTSSSTGPIETDDNTDEDFFDKLVNDDGDAGIGSTGSKRTVGGGIGDADFDEVKPVSNFNISEVNHAVVYYGDNVDPSGEISGQGNSILESVDDSVVAKQSDPLVPTDVHNDESSRNAGVVSTSEMDIIRTTLERASSIEVKEVEWSAFNSPNVQNGGAFGSDMLFDEFGNDSSNLSTNVAEQHDSADQYNATDSVLTSSSYVQNTNEQDLSNNQYWENLYPGWRYDPNTEQWYPVDGYDTGVSSSETTNFNMNAQQSSDAQLANASVVNSDQTSDAYYQSVSGSVADWTQNSLGNVTYPAYMVFDPQYPGWYYDTIAQEWRSLESYTQNLNQLAGMEYNQQVQGENVQSYGYGSQTLSSQNQFTNWDGSVHNYNEQPLKVWQAQSVSNIETTNTTNHSSSAVYEPASQNVGHSFETSPFQNFNPSEQNFKSANQHMNFRPSYDGPKSVEFTQQQFMGGAQFPSSGRPPHALVGFGFGGKLLVMKNNSSFQSTLAYENQDLEGGMIKVHNLMEVVMDKTNVSCGMGSHDYFYTLCHQSFPGPLVGGHVGNKEVHKWVDDRIAKCGSESTDYGNREVLCLLFSLLKIACQFYGKLRSPFGTDQALKGSNSPESAVASLLASVKKSEVQLSGYGALKHCLQNLPSEAQLQATALEVQKLLVSGRKNEALRYAQEGHLWGPALILASQLGEQFYAETVKQLALEKLVAGSPIRTLCLLIAGQPADVFSSTSATISSSIPGYVVASQPPAQIGSNCMLDAWEENLAIITANRTKDDELVIIHLGDCLWKERAEKATPQVSAAHVCYLIAEANFEQYSDSARLCLLSADHWKFPRTFASPQAIQMTELYEYSKVLGNSQFLLLPFQPYKLIYAHMLVEVGKVADSLKYCQAVLKSLKTGRAPEVDTWKQLAISLEERLKTHQQGGFSSNLAPTKLMGKLLNFFDNTTQRATGGGLPPPIPSPHSSNQRNGFGNQHGGQKVSSSQSAMAMSSLMPSASMEPISGWNGETNRHPVPNRSVSEPDFSRSPKKVDVSILYRFMVFLCPTRVQVTFSKEVNTSDTPEKASSSGGSSRFGRFGAQLFQKTVGFVIRSRPHKQAKLGDTNKFYYDEKLKRWVEEGVEPPGEEAALPPPPTTAGFQSGSPDHNGKDGPKNDGFPQNLESPTSSERGSGMPPMPPSSNQFSARGRAGGVRSRYVDTFNKGSATPPSLFQSPATSPAAKPGGAPKLFIPAPVIPVDDAAQTGENVTETYENSSMGFREDSFPSPQQFSSACSSPVTIQRQQFSSACSSPVAMQRQYNIKPPLGSSPTSSNTMQRFPSMDNIVLHQVHNKRPGGGIMRDRKPSSIQPHYRRTASWGGGSIDLLPSPSKDGRRLGEHLGMPLSPLANPKLTRVSSNVGNPLGDGLQEVEL
ncbi:hypothetical protein ACFE04_018907 [Oxalis oulophora]